jgi:DNA-binding transcriptional LysR family regulator
MSPPLPPLNALRAFEAIARHLSFAKAADELHVTPAALSHQIRALEEQLGLATVSPPHPRDRTHRCRPVDLSGPARRLRERARRDGAARSARATATCW